MIARTLALTAAAVLSAACTAEKRPAASATAAATTAATAAATAAAACFGSRVLSYQDIVAEVVIPVGERCDNGTFTVVFTHGTDTLGSLSETRRGVVGFIGTADVNGDGRGEFFVATTASGPTVPGALYAYTESADGIKRMQLAALDSTQRAGYTGGDRFGFGAPDQLVHAFPLGGSDTAWFGYSHRTSRWVTIARPSWLR